MKKKPLIDESGEVRELTSADIRKFRPAREMIPHIVAAYEAGTLRVRGRPKSSEKSAISLRLDNDIIERLRASGAGWQTRINDILRTAIFAKSGHVRKSGKGLPTGR